VETVTVSYAQPGDGIRSFATHLPVGSYVVHSVVNNSTVGADGNWLARSTEPGVVVAYDFSAPPANGGDWKWGSLKPGVTVELFGRNAYPYDVGAGKLVEVDTTMYPPGSSASLKYNVKGYTGSGTWDGTNPQPSVTSLAAHTNGIGELGLNWRILLENYADQFGENQEFWLQFRCRMNDAYALWAFRSWGHDWGGPFTATSYTGMKWNFISAGPQFPQLAGAGYFDGYAGDKFYNGFGGGVSVGNPSGNPYNSTNTAFSLVCDGAGEIEVTSQPMDPRFNGGTNSYKWPYPYNNKYGNAAYEGWQVRGQDSNYVTMRNDGNEPVPLGVPASCQFIPSSGGSGDQYTTFATPMPGEVNLNRCFVYLPNQWMTLMIHVKLGTIGTANTSGGDGALHHGYINSVGEVWAGYDPTVIPGAVPHLIHRRSGLVFQIAGSSGIGGPVSGEGSSGPERYGSFGLTTFMTNKWPGDPHPMANCWYSQIILKAGPIPPAAPDDGPAWTQGLSDFQVRNLTGAYAPSNGKVSLSQVLPPEWQGGSSPIAQQQIIGAWSGGKGDTDGKRLFVTGGGHNDCANNGLYIYDFNGAASPTGWVLAPNSLSALSAIQNGAVYSDNKPSSVHTYDGLWYSPTDSRFYRIGGSRYSSGSICTSHYYDVIAQQWSSVALGGGAFTTFPSGLLNYGLTVMGKDDGSKLFVLNGDTNYNCAFVNKNGTQTTVGWPAGFHANSNGSTMVAVKLQNDSTWLTLSLEGGVSYIYTHAIDWTNQTDTATLHSHSSHATYLGGSAGASMIYDPNYSGGACVWIFGMTSQISGGVMAAQILRLNISDWSITSHALSDTIAVDAPGSQGSYNRHVWFPQWRIIATVQSNTAPMSIIKLPSA
jgi:hypothetical protein